MSDGPIELMARARSGQDEALGELCHLYRNYLRMVVRTGLGPRLRQRVELSDVVQEALVEVVRQFPQFTGESEAALVGWLRRLVSQKLADLGRYHSRAKRAGDQGALPLDAAWDAPAGGAGGGDGGGGRLLDILALSQTSPSEDASRRELACPARRRPPRAPRGRGRGPLALPRRGPFVRGDRRTQRRQPQGRPRPLGSRPQGSQTPDRPALIHVKNWGYEPMPASDHGPLASFGNRQTRPHRPPPGFRCVRLASFGNRQTRPRRQPPGSPRGSLASFGNRQSRPHRPPSGA